MSCGRFADQIDTIGGEKMQLPPMSSTEYAKHAGVSVQTVGNWIKKGKISPDCLISVKDPDGKTRRKIISHLADECRAGSLIESKKRGHKKGGRPRKGGQASGAGKKSDKEKITEALNVMSSGRGEEDKLKSLLSIAGAQRVTLNLKAELVKMDVEERKGTLVKKSDYDLKIQEVLRLAVTDLQAIPRKSHILAELAAMSSIEDIEKVLTRVVYDSLTDLTAKLEKLEKVLGV